MRRRLSAGAIDEGDGMSGRYWDVRTCSWLGGAPDVSSERWHTGQQDEDLRQAVPPQPTAADVEAEVLVGSG